MKTGTGSITYPLNFEELLFSNKNKSYGAYALRRSYGKYLNTACIIVIFIFSVGVSLPLLLKKDLPVPKRPPVVQRGPITFEPPPIGVDKKIEKPISLPGIKTIKFTVPQVKPDEMVDEKAFPTIDELKNVAVSTTTQAGTGDEIIIEETPPVEAPKAETEAPFTYVEQMPNYPGGEAGLYAFLAANIKYPELAIRAGIEGRVIVSYIVEKDGSLTDINLAKGLGGGCSEEAIRVVSLMNKWSPGKQNGHAVRVKMMIPIVFKLR